MSISERKRTVRERELCNNCLKPFHQSKDCFGKPCLRCELNHNILLCPENPQNKVVTNVQVKNSKKRKFNQKSKLTEQKVENKANSQA